MEAQCKQAEVAALVKEYITAWDEPKNYLETLDMLFDAWIGYPDDFCYTQQYRSTVLSHYRNLQQLMVKLQAHDSK